MCAQCAPFETVHVTTGDSVFTQADVPPWLRTPRDVDDFKGRTETTERHTMQFEDILAKYDFRNTGWRTRCCLGHPHSQGVIVKTNCGLILAMGETCAENAIDGLKNAIKRAHAVDDYFAALRAIDVQIEDIPKLLPSVSAANKLAEFKRAFRTNLSYLASDLRNRQLAASYPGAVALWIENAPDIPELHGRFATLKASRRDLKGAVARVVKKTAKAFDQLSQAVKAARDWYDRAYIFATPDVLERVLNDRGVAATVDRNGVIHLPARHAGGRAVEFGLGVHQSSPRR